MKNYFFSKKGVSVAFSASVIIVLLYILIMLNYNNLFSVETIVGSIKPIAVAGISMFIFSLVFFFFPEKVFNSWLKKIAWWYFLGLFLIVSNTPVFSSNILFTSRSETMFGGMLLLALITITFIYFERKRI